MTPSLHSLTWELCEERKIHFKGVLSKTFHFYAQTEPHGEEEGILGGKSSLSGQRKLSVWVPRPAVYTQKSYALQKRPTRGGQVRTRSSVCSHLLWKTPGSICSGGKIEWQSGILAKTALYALAEVFVLVALSSPYDWRPVPDWARAVWRSFVTASGAPSWTTCGTDQQPALFAENLALVPPRTPCREPSWVKVSEKLYCAWSQIFRSILTEVQENYHWVGCLQMLECVYRTSWCSREDWETSSVLLILEAAPVYPDWSDNAWACVFCLSLCGCNHLNLQMRWLQYPAAITSVVKMCTLSLMHASIPCMPTHGSR